jgi:hypothetical protein
MANSFNPHLILYIPRMNTFWASPERVTEVFEKQNIGSVSRVDIIKTKVSKQRKQLRSHIGGDYIRSAHVYFNEWHDTQTNRNLQARVLNPKKDARIVFDDPWYWLLIESDRNKDDVRLRKTEAKVDMLIQNEKEFNLTLKKQCESIQRLQDFCMSKGLSIPFWSANNPPSEDISDMELSTAETAVSVAEDVLKEDDDRTSVIQRLHTYCINKGLSIQSPEIEQLLTSDIELLTATAETAVSAAEHVLREDDYSYTSPTIRCNGDFVPVQTYADIRNRTYGVGETVPFLDADSEYHESYWGWGC